jgi:hypothetical protein
MSRTVLLATLAMHAKASSLYLANLCAGHSCPDDQFPILDYDAADARCICRANPCWDDTTPSVFGKKYHSCNEQSGLHLRFGYTADRNLTCSCSRSVHESSVYVARDLCPGHSCDSKGLPILDWDPAQGRCICRKHPCKDESSNPAGPWHSCDHPQFPLLTYREKVDHATGKSKSVCDCVRPRLNRPSSQLRGRRSDSSRSDSEFVTLASGERCGLPTCGNRCLSVVTSSMAV